MLKKFLPILFISIFFLFPNIAFASVLNLSPSGGQIGVGSNLTVSVKLNTQGEGVNAVSAFLSYPADKLDVTYVTGGSTFAIEAEKSFGGGVIKISRGNINPVNGNVTVATIGFRGKALGSAKVAFTSGSAAPRASDSLDSLNLGSSSGGTYSIVQSQPKPPQPKPSEAPVVTAPKISSVKVTNIATNSATISWLTDKPADSYIEYGLEPGKYFLNASDGNLVTTHSITLESPILTAGAKFHFRVISKDSSNNSAMSEDMNFQLTGNLNLADKKSKSSQLLIDRIVAGILVVGIIGLILIGIFLVNRKIRRI